MRNASGQIYDVIVHAEKWASRVEAVIEGIEAESKPDPHAALTAYLAQAEENGGASDASE